MDLLLPDDLVQQITVDKLQRRFGGGSERTWDRERAVLVQSGILVRRGNRIYGRLGDVAAYLMGALPCDTMEAWPAVTLAAGRGSR